jgi:hypothetical protein
MGSSPGARAAPHDGRRALQCSPAPRSPERISRAHSLPKPVTSPGAPLSRTGSAGLFTSLDAYYAAHDSDRLGLDRHALPHEHVTGAECCPACDHSGADPAVLVCPCGRARGDPSIAHAFGKSTARPRSSDSSHTPPRRRRPRLLVRVEADVRLMLARTPRLRRSWSPAPLQTGVDTDMEALAGRRRVCEGVAAARVERDDATTGSAVRCWTRKAVKGGSRLSFGIHRSRPCVFTVFSAYIRKLIRAQAPFITRPSPPSRHEALFLRVLAGLLLFHLPPVLHLLPLQLHVHLDQRCRVADIRTRATMRPRVHHRDGPSFATESASRSGSAGPALTMRARRARSRDARKGRALQPFRGSRSGTGGAATGSAHSMFSTASSVSSASAVSTSASARCVEHTQHGERAWSGPARRLNARPPDRLPHAHARRAALALSLFSLDAGARAQLVLARRWLSARHRPAHILRPAARRGYYGASVAVGLSASFPTPPSASAYGRRRRRTHGARRQRPAGIISRHERRLRALVGRRTGGLAGLAGRPRCRRAILGRARTQKQHTPAARRPSHSLLCRPCGAKAYRFPLVLPVCNPARIRLFEFFRTCIFILSLCEHIHPSREVRIGRSCCDIPSSRRLAARSPGADRDWLCTSKGCFDLQSEVEAI